MAKKKTKKPDMKELGASGGKAVRKTMGKEWFSALAKYQHGSITKTQLNAIKAKIQAKRGKK